MLFCAITQPIAPIYHQKPICVTHFRCSLRLQQKRAIAKTSNSITSAAAFRGDGTYVSDGGALLQALWCYCEWKEIRNCPGRYTVRRRRDLARWPPERLLAAALGGNVPPVSLWRHRSGAKDAIHAVRFAGGGGLLTYARADGAFVHTLNTELSLIHI